MSALTELALKKAIGYIGQMEEPPGSNDGPFVASCLHLVGLPPKNYWCAAFVYRCFHEAAIELGIANPVPKTAGVLDMRNKTSSDHKTMVPQVGSIFILKFSNTAGHTGIVKEINGTKYRAVEGNSDPAGGRNGIGVFVPKWRNIADANIFLNF